MKVWLLNYLKNSFKLIPVKIIYKEEGFYLKLGIVGGLGPASTIDYYREIIESYRRVRGEDNYPEIVIDSVNMGELVMGIRQHDYEKVAGLLLSSISNLEKAGADFIAIASNSPHIVWDKIKDKTPVMLVSIIDAVCDYIIVHNFRRVLVFATEFTMKNGLYSNALSKRNVEYILPSDEDIKVLGSIIYPNLENGIVLKKDKEKMIAIAEKYIKLNTADSILLGCTEIPLMIKPADVSVPVINSTKIHIDKICDILINQ